MSVVHTYRPTAKLANGLQVLLAVTGGLTLISTAWVSSVLRDGTFLLHVPARRGDVVAPSYWTGTMLPSFTWVASLLSLATIVVWLIWQHHATANLWARGYAGVRTRPGWAVGWWFIPIAELWMPLVTVLELDRRSTVDGQPRAANGWLLGGWWTAWLAYRIVPVIGFMAAFVRWSADLARQVDTMSPARDQVFDFSALAHEAAPWLLVSGILAAVAAALAILVVRRIADGQAALEDSTYVWSPVPARPDAIA